MVQADEGLKPYESFQFAASRFGNEVPEETIMKHLLRRAFKMGPSSPKHSRSSCSHSKQGIVKYYIKSILGNFYSESLSCLGP